MVFQHTKNAQTCTYLHTRTCHSTHTHITPTHMQCQHTRRSVPHQLAVRLLLYRVCHKVESLRARGRVWYGRHSAAAAAASRANKQKAEMWGFSTQIHRPACTYSYSRKCIIAHSQQRPAMQCPHRHSSSPDKLDVRLLLYCCGCHKLEIYYSSGAKQLTCGFSIVLVGSSSPEGNPVITWHISRLWTPRERATEPARDPNSRRGVQAGPLRAPQPRARDKTHGRRKKACKCPKKETHISST